MVVNNSAKQGKLKFRSLTSSLGASVKVASDCDLMYFNCALYLSTYFNQNMTAVRMHWLARLSFALNQGFNFVWKY